MLSSYLVLAVISLLSSSVFSAEWIDCGPPKSFEVELENDEKVFVFDAELQVQFDRNELSIYEHPGISAVNFLINNTVVTFTGHIVRENEDLDPSSLKTSRVFNSKIAGSARLTKTASNDILLTDYNLYLSRSRKEEEKDIPKRVQVEIIHEAAACARAGLAERIGPIGSVDLARAVERPFEFGGLSVLSTNGPLHEVRISAEDARNLVAAYENATLDADNVDKDGLQSTINKIVDLAVAQLVKKIAEENGGKIEIPEIHQNFSTGSSIWKITGDFDAIGGTFIDLTSLKRTEDALVLRNGLKFMASCGFGLSKAFMQYEKYKLRYGLIKVSGKFSGNVDGVAMKTTVGVDYNQKPCRFVLQELRFSELGKIKIKITGLGPLNKLLSRLVSWITKKWQDDIAKIIENKLRSIILGNLDKLNCEKYRP